MTGIFQDSLDKDRHQTFKRYERRAQWFAWKRRGEEREAPPLPCLVPSKSGEPAGFQPGYLIKLFEGDFALVRYAESAGELSGLRLLRSGIPWEQWHPWILSAYLRGAIVPQPFVPLRRIPPGWTEEALTRSPHMQLLFFDRLRETRLLPALSKLDAPTLAPWMRWEDARANFIDFKSVRDNPQTQSNIPGLP